MEVQLWPHPGRPGVGLKPRNESQRPLLPQHARHCPVLEAGSGLGYSPHYTRQSRAHRDEKRRTLPNGPPG